jgi:hypothetical protein
LIRVSGPERCRHCSECGSAAGLFDKAARGASWRDEAAFDVHAALPSTIGFVERASRLIDHPFDVARSKAVRE